jgi:hypothetical protein
MKIETLKRIAISHDRRERYVHLSLLSISLRISDLCFV